MTQRMAQHPQLVVEGLHDSQIWHRYDLCCAPLFDNALLGLLILLICFTFMIIRS